jgi:hypothetical protein
VSFFEDRERTNWPSWKAAWDWRDMRRELDRLGSKHLSDAQWRLALAIAGSGKFDPWEAARLIHARRDV